MPELRPLPIGVLLRRLVREFQREGKVFDLPAASFWRGSDEVSMGVRCHGKPAGTPFGPAAGPHTQMAQNIVLGWLVGARIIELKTIQINDRLTIPRPCIDATNVGYNVEFSQELRLEQSLEEYVKAWMLVRMIEHLGLLGVPARRGPTPADALPHFYDCIFDLSCGYDLQGIASPRVQWFIRSMMDASEEIERLKRQIPDEFAELRQIDYDPHIVSTATLSTFHGCPPNEIEGIVEHLLRVNGLHVVIKMNPTMLGRDRVETLLHEQLGFEEIRVNPAAFESGLGFEESIRLVRRLRSVGREHGLQVGVKFTNTLEVLNHREFFPKSEKIMYMSGAPLYPMALELAYRFREAYLATATDAWDASVPISFSAGVDKHNFADCVAAGMVPVTVCTDLLKQGGYARALDYLKALSSRMSELGTRTIAEFIMASAGAGDGPEAAALRNHEAAWQRALADPHYTKAKNSLVPKRIGTRLWLFDCISCDKCIPVCPNNANFYYHVPKQEIPYRNYEWSEDGTWRAVDGETFAIKKPHQIANFGQFCNECGNCDTFCPEYGGPYIEKPTFFACRKDWEEFRTYDGFFVEHAPEGDCLCGRIRGEIYALRVPHRSPSTAAGSEAHEFETPAGLFAIHPVTLQASPLELRARSGKLDVGLYLMLRTLLEGVLDAGKINYINAAFPELLAREP